MTNTCGGIRAANWVIRRRRLKSDNYLKRCNLLAMALLVDVVDVVVGAKYPCNDRAYFQAPIILSRLHRQVSIVRKSITYLPNGSRSANSENRCENREYRSSRWEPTGSDHENWVRWGTRRARLSRANSTRFCSVFCELYYLLTDALHIPYSVTFRAADPLTKFALRRDDKVMEANPLPSSDPWKENKSADALVWVRAIFMRPRSCVPTYKAVYL